MKKFIKKSFIVILFIAFFLPSVSFAGEIFFNSNKNIFALNEEFLVQVFIDTKGTTVNALEGNIVYPADLLEFKEVRDGNSSVNFWIEKPHHTSAGIYFSGITAGGFSGTKRLIFEAVFKAKIFGNGTVAVSDLQVLQNDGVGTKVAVDTIPFSFSILKESDTAPENLKVTDTDPPEGFTPFIARDSTIFDGKYFIVFSTVDKGAGIDHYEVREGVWGDYIRAESPYVLKDQSLSKDIIIKAVDKSGNKISVRVKAQNPNFSFEKVVIIGIILLICFFATKKIWLRFTR